ncbi:B12-binding domain-containing radical SAM protein [Methanobrevibacter smithii]|jgi:anaerobic magnesium-protoporphyrin IX monomethyl ester cyclase|uniref:Radical SAM domain protein n=2 Tax=Methanobrevibacter smithii TaxID=2173 RepID=D2ZMI8_METSM|nr:radical SAM protein [Methanobrevibacter smithii]MBP8705839.1 B12-binding domain-containing radical SAM protein [Methanobrevibacter sp.]EEE42786.1 radical SAM domain protein [Methanobrevibacter smithii DSM 2375]EFC94066.1 radical SAM domain protein [Methanobrevibacter smithii DSM 2374]MBT9658618.1 B12-binding domain-containing radical SAM protein [Methanobrevibacter smithii]MDO5830707.1 radical SAM protein [Methanobrevibacter smithii]
MKVLFVNPPQTASKYKFMGVIAPPLGIAYMAGVLQENNIDVEILDASAEDMDFKDVEKELLKRKPDLVALTALTPTIGRALETAQVVKETLPDSIVVMGGYHPTFNFIETLEDENVDIVIRGEGEYIMLNLVQALENQSSLHDVKGIVFEDKNSKEIVVNPEAPLIQDLDELPFPALNLLPMKKYRLLDMDTHMTTMITTRGCPMQCSFCSSAAMHGKKIRERSVENIVDEIEYLKTNYDIDTIAFMDDTFTLKKRKVMAICDEILKRNIEIMWGCTSRVDTLDEKLLKKMKEAGCITIFIGVESADQQQLDNMCKNTTIAKIENAFKIAHKLKIRTIASVALGMPGDTKEIMNKTVKFVHKLKPNYAIYSLATPYPGTRFYKEAFEKNLIKIKDWSKYTLITPILETIDCSLNDMRKIQAKAFMKFYLRPHYIIRQFLQDGPYLLKTIFGVIKTALSKTPKNTDYNKRELKNM